MAYTYKHGDRPLDDFTIQRAVGRGGFGEVYYAVSDGGREVALKYLRENPHVELRGVSHCINLKSPHLVSIFDVRKNADGEYFIIMEYSSGPSLRELLMAEPEGLGPQKAAFFLREIAKGLAYLHDRGIVHRDLKPGNIFYDEGYVKIGDYGLSKFISVSRHSAQTASVGTVHYMAPEVGSGNYHRGIDIYALGVMLYEMLLGKVPFEGSSMGEVLMKHLTEQPEVDDLPAPFGKIIRKALQKDPNDRYQTVYEMVDDLLEVDDIKTSLAGFNPVSLSTVERQAAPISADSPAPSPNPGPAWPPPPAPGQRRHRRRHHRKLDTRRLPPKVAKRITAVSEKVSRRVRKLEAKHGRRAAVPSRGSRPPLRPRPSSATPRHRGEVLQRVLLAAALAVGLGFGVGLLAGAGEEAFVSAILTILGMSAGVAIGCRLVARAAQRRPQPSWVERMYLTGPVAALTAVGIAPLADAKGEDALGAWAALVVVTFVIRWGPRIRRGAEGELSAGKAFWVGLFALILASAFTRQDEEYFILAGGVAASASLVVQALAWLFPLDRWLDGELAPAALPSGRNRHQRATYHWRSMFSWVSDRRPAGAATDEARDDEARAADLAASAPLDNKPDAPAAAFLDRPRRWAVTRFLGGLIGFACLVGMVICIAFLVQGEGYYFMQRTWIERDGQVLLRTATPSYVGLSPVGIIGIAATGGACLGLMLFAFRKATRFKTGGFYRDTLRPLLMTFALAGLAASSTTLIGEYARAHEGIVAAKGGLILSITLLLFLVCKRGRRLPQTPCGSTESRA